MYRYRVFAIFDIKVIWSYRTSVNMLALIYLCTPCKTPSNRCHDSIRGHCETVYCVVFIVFAKFTDWWYSNGTSASYMLCKFSIRMINDYLIRSACPMEIFNARDEFDQTLVLLAED